MSAERDMRGSSMTYCAKCSHHGAEDHDPDCSTLYACRLKVVTQLVDEAVDSGGPDFWVDSRSWARRILDALGLGEHASSTAAGEP